MVTTIHLLVVRVLVRSSTYYFVVNIYIIFLLKLADLKNKKHESDNTFL